MPATPTILLAAVGIALLLAGFLSMGGALRVVSGGAALLLAVGATAAAVGLFWAGHKAHWTSDGPGILLVMIAVVVCAVVAVFGWILVVFVGGAVAAPSREPPDPPGAIKRALRLTGFALLAIAAAVEAYTARGRVAHGAPVVGVAFASARPRLVTMDAGGTVVAWDLSSKRELDRHTRPELAGAAELVVDPGGERGFAIVGGRAVSFEPFKDAPVTSIPDARHVAGGSSVVVATDRALLFVPYAEWKNLADRRVAWPDAIMAIAARGMFVAVADRASVSLLDGRWGQVRTLASVPAPGVIHSLAVTQDGWIAALDAGGATWAIDARRGITERLDGTASLAAGGQRLFSVSGRAVSHYDPATKTASEMATIAPGARAIDATGEQVALGFENGEVALLSTRTGSRVEIERLATRPAAR